MTVFAKHSKLGRLLATTALAALAGSAQAQHPIIIQGPNCPQYRPAVPPSVPAPAATPTQPTRPPEERRPSDQPSTTPSPETSPDTQAPDFGQGEASAVGGEATAMATPNMFGDLLYGFRSVRYTMLSNGRAPIVGIGSTSITNPAVAEDNSPLPRDRISFRYNHYSNALAVSGFGPSVLGLPQLPPGTAGSPPVTREYDVNLYTFGFEKTFLDQMASVELRVPFASKLGSRLNVSAGSVTGSSAGPFGFDQFDVTETPLNSLGNEKTEFQNLKLIFKGVGYRNCWFLLSGGVGLEIPTAPDTDVRVTDYFFLANQPTGATNPRGQRVRNFHIDNETWGVDPFLAFLATPTNRWFAQGFLQFDLPVGKSDVTYSAQSTLAPSTPFVQNGPVPMPPFAADTQLEPFSSQASIRDQVLMHVNIGTGYWLLRDPDANWLTGIAPAVELHYTSTLNNAQIVNLPPNFARIFDPTNPGTQAAPNFIPEPRPQVGNFRNRMDILNLTGGVTFWLADKATLGLAASVPLKGDDNRVFDWEGQVRLNYFFGPRPSQNVAPALFGGS